MEVRAMTVRVWARLASLTVFFCAFASAGAAQQLALSGTVRDTTGVVPGATVTLSSGGKEVSR
jgi:hypothetical protein